MQVSEKVRRVLQAEHIIPEELQYMITRAANTRIRSGNRRYFSWLFTIVGETVVDMQHMDLVELGKGSSRMLEEHEECHGQGCRACGWVGEISRGIKDTTAALLNVPSVYP